MALPKFRTNRRHPQVDGTTSAADTPTADTSSATAATSDRTAVSPTSPPPVNLKVATKLRKKAIILAAFFFFISWIFLILVLIGNTYPRRVLRSTYFFKLDLTNIIPASATGGITFVNSLARSLGLHDFYQVGLWNFCEGYNDDGITNCSKPQTLYWFNPVEIILNELLAGATIVLPQDINDILKLIRIASRVMFGFYLTGACMNFISTFVGFVALYSRWWSAALAIWTFIGALLTTVATVIGTVMFIIFRNVITSQPGLNIGAEVGTQMFAFMWVGAAGSLLGFAIHAGLLCCCASRRDVKTGRRRGSRAAYLAQDEKISSGKRGVSTRRGMLPGFGRKTESDIV